MCNTLRVAGAVAFLASANTLAEPTSAGDATDEGRSLYQYYCYQCHGYAGNAKTLASTYLAPPPRDFTSTPVETLPRDSMIDAVLFGKPGTAMVGFASVISRSDAEAVVTYVRDAFMKENSITEEYHSAANGWPNHERYAAAFPFIDGTLAVDIAWESLTETQQAGRRLYEMACVSCHDQPSGLNVDSTVWELRAVSYPRRHFTHRDDENDWVSAASPYRLHDRPPGGRTLTDEQKAGKQLFEANCAFCHAVDGSGKNWIGSFLEPRPRDLSDPDLHRALGASGLRQRIENGMPNTSMPAWKQVLSEAEIDAIIAYVRTGLSREP